MTALELVMAPAPIFKQKAMPVTEFDEALEKKTAAMLDVLYSKRGIGLGANMVGLLERIIVVDLQENGVRKPLICINPKLVSSSDDTSSEEEASLCFPGISAEIQRPNTIEITYQDTAGNHHSLEAEGWLARVIQHEMEYLEGRTFLDNLSKLKRDRLVKRMVKDMKQSSGCSDPSCCPPS